jgi:uncharacterized protein YcbK (DUF882 family)
LIVLNRTTAWLLAALCALSATLAPNALESAAANGDTRTIYLFHTHTKEAIAATFRNGGHYDAQALDKLNWFLRDWRNDEPTHMDPRLFDALWEAYRSAGRNTGPDDPIMVLSAYRCPATNAMLRARSKAVAEHSQHMLGKAMDSTMPGLSMEKLREIAMRMQRGGVGYYPNVPFVHIDVGGVRHWPRMNYDQLVRLFPDGKTVHIPSNGRPLAGYEEARAEIVARGGEAISIADATNSGGGIFGFFARLFGGGADEVEDREVAPEEPKPTKLASRGRRHGPATQQPGDSETDPSRQVLASAEADLPRGETYMGAPAAAPPPPPPAAPAPQRPAPAAAAPEPPQPVAIAPRPAPEPQPEARPAAEREAAPAEAPAADADKPATADVPLPPRRPTLLASLDAPLPPPRPADLAKLPDVITHGEKLGGTTAHGADSVTLAYAGPSPQAQRAAAPLPPSRPSLTPLRAAAQGKAEERAARAANSQMAPARVGRGALKVLAAPAPELRARPAISGGVAPPLRAAARNNVLAAHATAKGVDTSFSTQATPLSPSGFAKK